MYTGRNVGRAGRVRNYPLRCMSDRSSSPMNKVCQWPWRTSRRHGRRSTSRRPRDAQEPARRPECCNVDAKWLVRRYPVVRGQPSLNKGGDGNGVRHNVRMGQYDVRCASRSRPRHSSLDRHKDVGHFEGLKHERIHVFSIYVTSVMGYACKTALEESKNDTRHASRRKQKQYGLPSPVLGRNIKRLKRGLGDGN